MKLSLRKGFGFGLTSGIITTLGLIVGLQSGTDSSTVVIGGILVIAIADAMSDASGMHVSQEFENTHSTKEVWESTLSTFFAKLIVALTFVIPIVLLPLSTAIIVCIIWGLSLIVILNYFIAKEEGVKPYKVILEHLMIAVIVVVITHFVGNWIKTL